MDFVDVVIEGEDCTVTEAPIVGMLGGDGKELLVFPCVVTVVVDLLIIFESAVVVVVVEAVVVLFCRPMTQL